MMGEEIVEVYFFVFFSVARNGAGTGVPRFHGIMEQRVIRMEESGVRKRGKGIVRVV